MNDEPFLIHGPGQWENDQGPEGWYAVSDVNGIFAYTSTQELAQFLVTALEAALDPGNATH